MQGLREVGDGLSNLPSPFAYLLTIHLKEGRNLVVRDRCGKAWPCVPLVTWGPLPPYLLSTLRVSLFCLSTAGARLELSISISPGVKVFAVSY